jgi:phosphatidylglycerol lysyltransferase
LSRAEFYRRGAVLAQEYSVGWVAAIVLGVGFAVWVGFLSFRHVPYSQELWWQFAFHSGAPRMLRAGLVAGLALATLAFWKLLRGGAAAQAAESATLDLDRVRAVIAAAGNASANAALTGDKRFLWSPNREAFIMYQRSGNHWIALGGPVGPESEREDLAWAFRALADRNDGRVVFYEVTEDTLPLYVDMGLSLAKLGEEAWVPLEGFSLEGKRHAQFRQAVNRARREGMQFQVIPSGDLGPILPDLRAVSDDWLRDKSGSEKGFSMGAFSESYVANFDCAVVRSNEGIVAFANLWAAPAAGELSVDLMRYNGRAPKGVMDYLFTELMLWARNDGFAWFNLGMAPLSGLDQHELAPIWHKLGGLVFRHGDAFYHFEGLRRYKQKFTPEWRARYIACRGGLLGLPHALLESSKLISGGVAGMLRT